MSGLGNYKNGVLCIIKVLLVEDDEQLVSSVNGYIKNGIEVLSANNTESASEKCNVIIDFE